MAARILGQVPDASELLASLAAAVVDIGPGTSLADKVAQAQNHLAANDVAETCSTLAAFVNEVQAVSGTRIDSARAAALIADAQEIKMLLDC
jgi:hypothetical protein